MLLALILPLVSVAFSSCGGDDDDEPAALPSFGIASPQMIEAEGSSFDFIVLNYSPRVNFYVHDSWISVNVNSTGRCTITVKENKSSEPRVGEVTMMLGDEYADNLTISQRGASGGGGNDDPEPEPGNDKEFGAPTGLTLSKDGCHITLKWNAVPGATRYEIYYSNPIAYDSGVFVTMYSTSETTFAHDYKIAGNWAFKIMAYNGSEYSDYSNTVTTRITESDINGGGGGGGDQPSGKPSKPTGLTAKVSGNQVEVSWSASAGASYYRLYYVQPEPYGIESFDNVYSTSTTMTCRIQGKWTIWVVAVNSDYVAGDPSEKVTFTVGPSGGGGSSDRPGKLDTPTGLTVTSRAHDPFVQLECNGVTLGYEYQLYRSKSPNSGYSRITASTGTNASGTMIYFTDQNPLNGTSYYKVKVSALPSLGIKESDFSDYVKVIR